MALSIGFFIFFYCFVCRIIVTPSAWTQGLITGLWINLQLENSTTCKSLLCWFHSTFEIFLQFRNKKGSLLQFSPFATQIISVMASVLWKWMCTQATAHKKCLCISFSLIIFKGWREKANRCINGHKQAGGFVKTCITLREPWKESKKESIEHEKMAKPQKLVFYFPHYI